MGKSIAWKSKSRYDFLTEAKKVVFLYIGPSKVATASIKLTLIFPETLSLFPSRCLITNVDAKALSYLASNADEVNFKSSIKDTFKIPWAPPELP